MEEYIWDKNTAKKEKKDLLQICNIILAGRGEGKVKTKSCVK